MSSELHNVPDEARVETIEDVVSSQREAEQPQEDEYVERNGFQIRASFVSAFDSGPLHYAEDAKILSEVFETEDDLAQGFAKHVWLRSGDTNFQPTPQDLIEIEAIQGWFDRMATRKDKPDR